jgi:hypothetical protein
MTKKEMLEKVLQELSELAKRKTMDNNPDRATELCKKLKEMGYSNKQVSELTGGAWSVNTIKRWTSGIEVKDPIPKQNTEKLLLEIIQRKILLDWVQQAVSIYETLKAEDLTLQDMLELLSLTRKAGIGNKELVDFFEKIKDSKLSIAELQKALVFKSNSSLQAELQELQKQEVKTRGVIELHKELVDLGFNLDTLEELSKASEKYGGVRGVLETLNKYTAISELEQLEREVSEADSRLKKLQADHAHLETVISMSEELLCERGFSPGAIADIVEMARKYGDPMEAIRSLNEFGSLRAIQAEIEGLSSKRDVLDASNKELGDSLQELRAQSDEVNKTLTGLFSPIRKEFEDSARSLREEAATSIADISAKYEEYSRKVVELSLRAGALEEELRIARFIKAIVNYPSEMKELPLDYDLLMLKGVAQHCRVKEVNPKVKVNRNYGFISELELKELLDMAVEGLSKSVAQ